MSNRVFVYDGDVERPVRIHWGTDIGLVDVASRELIGYGYDDVHVVVPGEEIPAYSVGDYLEDEYRDEGLRWGDVVPLMLDRIPLTYVVSGVFTDTDNLQPFTYEHQATSAREAVAKSVDKADGWGGEDRNTNPDGDLAQATARANIRVVSVRIQTDEQELLHTVDELV